MQARFDYAVGSLRAEGYDVVVGRCMDGTGILSAPVKDRADELTWMLTDPTVFAVIPPWGGELALDLLIHLDFEAIRSAKPTWFIGYSDISTLLLPMTLRTSIATVHGNNLMDTPYAVPSPLLSWRDAVTAAASADLVQGPAARVRLQGFDDYESQPDVTEYTFDTTSNWKQLKASDGPLNVSGRLLGGCLETVAMLPGTAFGDIAEFARTEAPQGLIIYLEAAESDAAAVTRYLLHLRLAGWFDHANAVLIGRTRGGPSGSFTQLDALRAAFAGLDVPVVYDVDCGHVPPHLAILNGALGTVRFDAESASLTQTLI